eukprot:GILJ01011065.1.p1 GENE.GILJ01011065.1~~GILJ01011065.1.p1  ORF type:complete len:514 (+),score=93.99 GILJ01011065.1:26-1543(+)
MVIELLVALLLAGLTYVFYYFIYIPGVFHKFYTSQGLPATPFRYFAGDIPEILADMKNETVFRFSLLNMRKLGKIYLGFFGPQARVQISDPALVQEVLVAKAHCYLKPRDSASMLRRVIGEGMLLSEGEKWKRHRKMLTPAFHFTSLKQMIPMMVRCTKRGLDKLQLKIQQGEKLHDVSRVFSNLTLDIIGSSSFGTDFGESQADSDAVYESMTFLFEKVIHDRMYIYRRIPGYRQLPVESNRRFTYEKARLDGVVKKFIEARLADPCDPGKERDLLDLMLTASNGSPMSGTELRDECLTFILAGHETTSLLLSWCMLCLGREPAVLQRLMDEIDTVFPHAHAEKDEGEEEEEVTWEKISSLTYMTQVMKETLRLFPPAFMLGRVVEVDHEIGSYKICKGTEVVVNTFAMHHNELIWPEPEKFDPSRFDDKIESNKRHTCAWIPFGAGPRNCIGSNFAMLEAKIILTRFLQRFRFDMDPSHPVLYAPLITLRPKHGINMTLSVRS